MKQLVLFLSITLFFSLNSCNKGLSTNTIHERLIGTWKVEQVKFNPDGSLPSKDVTQKFQYYKFIFTADYSLTFIDATTEESYDGYYYIDETVTWNNSSQENDVKQVIKMSLYEPVTGNTKEFDWGDISISKSKMKVTEKRNGGKYKYQLIK
jgi:hypothetical protein